MIEPSSGSQAAGEAPRFPFQLVDAYLFSCKIDRREATHDDPEEPTFETSLETGSPDADGGFVAVVRVDITYRFRREAVCELTVATAGRFVKIADLAPGVEAEFRRLDCAVLIWPYARAHAGELGRMLGVGLPPLPTVDVRTLIETTE